MALALPGLSDTSYPGDQAPQSCKEASKYDQSSAGCAVQKGSISQREDTTDQGDLREVALAYLCKLWGYLLVHVGHI